MSEALGCTRLTKYYGPVVANRDVSLAIARGSIHAVIGENGAGKSTLMRALYGMTSIDAGEIRIGGEVVTVPSVEQSIARGVGMVHQHFMLVPNLTVAENLLLGRERLTHGRLAIADITDEIEKLARQTNLPLPPGFAARRVDTLSVGEKQRLEILRVLSAGARTLILDEPTAVLAPAQVTELFGALRALQRDAGATIVIVTHKLDEVMAFSERVTVMRKGEVVGEHATAQTDIEHLAALMIGRPIERVVTKRPERSGETRLIVHDLGLRRPDGREVLRGVHFAINAGEILGVCGIEGNGQSELVELLAGLLSAEDGVQSGDVTLDRKSLRSLSVRQRRDRGLRHIAEDRQTHGLSLPDTIERNFLLGQESAYTRCGFLRRAQLRRDTETLLARFDVRPADPRAIVRTLSGGNQQKIVVGRELWRTPRLLLCAQPTRGVDIGAIERIHAALRQAAAQGTAILLVSSELEEILALSDRIAVMHRGRIVGTRTSAAHDRATLKRELGLLMLGGDIGANEAST